MLRALDEAPLTRRYWVLALSVMVGAVLDLAAFSLLVGIAFLATTVEPHGRDLESIGAKLTEEAAAAR